MSTDPHVEQVDQAIQAGDAKAACVHLVPHAMPRRARLLGYTVSVEPVGGQEALDVVLHLLCDARTSVGPAELSGHLAAACRAAKACGDPTVAQAWIAYVARALDPEAHVQLGAHGLVVDLERRRAWYDGDPLPPFGRAVVQLRLLHAIACGLCTRKAIYESAWQLKYRRPSSDNALHVAITRLRKRLGPAGPFIDAQDDAYRLASPALVVCWTGALPAEDVTPASPAGLTSFVGREAELARLQAWSASKQRLLTVVGPGGMGKTRLAKEFAGERADVRFISLANARTSDQLLATVCGALSVPSAEAVCDALDARPCIVVLDNVEQVVDACADHVMTWLRGTDHARFLLTSRRALGVSAERCLKLPELSDGHARGLFVERAVSAGADAASIQGNEPVLDDIIDVLQGLPLALELAAARAGSAPLTLLRDRLLSPRSLRGGADLPPRQRSMHSALQWSWDLLDDAERKVLILCSAFRGGVPLAALDDVMPSEPSPFDQVLSLAEHSLVSVDDDGRVNLHALVAQFAASKDDGWAVGAHREWYLLAADQHRARLRGHDAELSLRWLRCELDNLCIASAACAEPNQRARLILAAAPALHLQAVQREVASLREVCTPDVSPALRVPLHVSLARANRDSGDSVRAAKHLQEAERLAEETGDPALLVLAGSVKLFGSLQTDSLPQFQAQIDRSRAFGDDLAVADALASMAVALRRLWCAEEAVERHRQALELQRTAGGLDEALWRHNYGVALLGIGRFVEAERQFQLALRIALRQEDRRLEGVVRAGRVKVAQKVGKASVAEAWARETVAFRLSIGDPLGAAHVRVVHAFALLDLVRHDEAVEQLGLARERLERAGYGTVWHRSRALIHMDLGELEQARTLLECNAADGLFAGSRVYLGAIAHLQGDPAAIGLFDDGLATFAGDVRAQVRLFRAIATGDAQTIADVEALATQRGWPRLVRAVGGLDVEPESASCVLARVAHRLARVGLTSEL